MAPGAALLSAAVTRRTFGRLGTFLPSAATRLAAAAPDATLGGRSAAIALFSRVTGNLSLSSNLPFTGARFLSSSVALNVGAANVFRHQSVWRCCLNRSPVPKILEVPAPPLPALHQRIQVRTIRTTYSARKKRKRVIKMAKGFRGRANRCYKIALNRVEKALQHAYRDRKLKKRQFRSLWIQRLNAGVRQHGLAYSGFIHKLHRSGVVLNRKMLAELAGMEPFSFKAVVDVVKMRTAVADGIDGL